MKIIKNLFGGMNDLITQSFLAVLLKKYKSQKHKAV